MDIWKQAGATQYWIGGYPCVIYSVGCGIVDFIVTSQKAAIIGRVAVSGLDPLEARSGSAGLHSKEFRSHLTHRITTI